MNSRRRVTAALIALLALVLGMWLAQHPWSGGPVSGDTSYPAPATCPRHLCGLDHTTLPTTLAAVETLSLTWPG